MLVNTERGAVFYGEGYKILEMVPLLKSGSLSYLLEDMDGNISSNFER